jgi:D-alanyl-D-alanine carboxypeptidase (penicillin-binding protein 5/6)
MVILLKDLFYGMMLPSGNDAAHLIAQIGGTIINLSRDNIKLEPILYDRENLATYVEKYNNNIIVYLNRMNIIAKFKAKTVNTSFANPHGLSNVNSLSTAEDMAKLSAYSMRNKKFR